MHIRGFRTGTPNGRRCQLGTIDSMEFVCGSQAAIDSEVIGAYSARDVLFYFKVGPSTTGIHLPYVLPRSMSTTEESTVTSPSGRVTTEPAPPTIAKKIAPHPFRVYGYKVSHAWVVQFGKDKGFERPGMSYDSLESAVFQYFIARLPGLQRHFLDDPDEPFYGWSHCLSIANNWNPKKKPLVAGRLPKWKAVLGTEEEPRWYIPTRDTIPPTPPEYRRLYQKYLSEGLAG